MYPGAKDLALTVEHDEVGVRTRAKGTLLVLNTETPAMQRSVSLSFLPNIPCDGKEKKQNGALTSQGCTSRT